VQKTKLISDFTTGSIPKQLTRFMLPFMASNALQVAYSLVDMVIVGQFVGSAGLAGVSQGSMLTNLFAMFCMGFSNGGQIIISQLIGANRKHELNSVIGTIFSVILSAGIVLSILALSLRGWIVEITNVPPEAKEMALSYILICGLGLVFTCGYTMVSAILRGMGDSRHPFIFITIAAVLNLALDLLLTGWLGYGVAGAAFATSFSQAVSFIISLIFLYRNKDAFYFDFKPSSFRIRWKVCKEVFRLGIPLALQVCAINFSMVICNSFINRLGVAATATFGVGTKIDDISNKISQGIQFAGAPMVGQNIGARNYKRVRTVVYWAWVFSFIIYGVFLACYLLFGREIFSLFTDDPAVIDLAPVFISAISWTFPALAIMRGTTSFLQGTGNATLLMVLAFADAIARVVLGYLIGIVGGFGFYGFVLGYAFAAYFIIIPGMLYFFFAPWTKRKSIMDDKAVET